jgi:hypothetical protein
MEILDLSFSMTALGCGLREYIMLEAVDACLSADDDGFEIVVLRSGLFPVLRHFHISNTELPPFRLTMSSLGDGGVVSSTGIHARL